MLETKFKRQIINTMEVTMPEHEINEAVLAFARAHVQNLDEQSVPPGARVEVSIDTDTMSPWATVTFTWPDPPADPNCD